MNTDEIVKYLNVNYHSSIQIFDFFFDPLSTDNLSKKAKVIFLTHTHYDHLDIPSIKNVLTPDTTIIATKDAEEVLKKNFPDNKKIYVSPNDRFEIEGATIEVLPAYNTNKNFHKKEYGWVGYKITKDNVSFAVLGDTDQTPELLKLKCDVLFIPIGGTYTMNAVEASELTNRILPKLVIPVHYNAIVGNKADERTFISSLDKRIDYKIFL